MLDKENDTLIINSKLLFTYKNKLIISDIEFDKDLKKSPINKNNNISTLQFPDDILSIHYLSSLNKILVSCISNKTLYLLDEKIIYNAQKTLSEFNLEKDALIFKSNKKMTSIISYQETKEKYFLLISKFQ